MNKIIMNKDKNKFKMYYDKITNPISMVKTKDNPKISLSSNKPVRDIQGAIYFEEMILQSNDNFSKSVAPKLSGNLSSCPFLAIMGNEYSNVNLSNIGPDAVATIKNTSTIDVSIMSHLKSFAQYCSIERPMPTERVIISYRNLVDADTGEIFKDNFGAYTTETDTFFSRKLYVIQNGTNGKNVLSLGTAIVPLSIKFTVTDATSNSVVLEGSDANGKGTLLYSVNKILGPGSVKIEYNTGTIIIEGNFDKYKLRIDATASLGDESGSTIKRVTTSFNHSSLNAEIARIDYVDEAVKLLLYSKNVTYTTSYNGDIIADAVNQLSNAFVNNLNNRVMAALIEAATTNGLEQRVFDMSQYNVGGSFVETKYDFIEQAIMEVASDFTFDSDQAATALFVTNSLAVLLSGIKSGSFVAANTIFSQNEGVIGTLNGMPVIRSRFLQKYEQHITKEALAITPKNPITGKEYIKIPFIFANKMIDGSAATLVVGEFLPIFSTSMINNYLNPTQFSAAFMAMNAVGIISKKLARIGYIIIDNTKTH